MLRKRKPSEGRRANRISSRQPSQPDESPKHLSDDIHTAIEQLIHFSRDLDLLDSEAEALMEADAISARTGQPRNYVEHTATFVFQGELIRVVRAWRMLQGGVAGGNMNLVPSGPKTCELKLAHFTSRVRKPDNIQEEILIRMKAAAYQRIADYGFPYAAVSLGKLGDAWVDENLSEGPFELRIFAEDLWKYVAPELDLSAACKVLEVARQVETFMHTGDEGLLAAAWWNLGYSFSRLEADTVPLAGDGKTKNQRATSGINSGLRTKKGNREKQKSDQRAINGRRDKVLSLAVSFRGSNPRMSDESLAAKIHSRLDANVSENTIRNDIRELIKGNRLPKSDVRKSPM
ncbi:hypothetical protein [Aquidulcibacter sp.]|uniref:hypothetical protein n=1 Tax=Aquidulcibacter sp. TaxID=2052990 RepID=UPI0025B9EBD8|nr:hypothetical protein [Aquidulcibacter sp.]MCA3692796.1 hypothetical protein [Aquidulcibacter sp.]